MIDHPIARALRPAEFQDQAGGHRLVFAKSPGVAEAAWQTRPGPLADLA
jgi:hypothetical protein